MTKADSLLACRGVTRKFGGLVALDGFDLDIEKGETIGLIGPNGSGKTTFFNVITGIYDFSSGEAVFDGVDLTRASAQQTYQAGITRTFQRSRVCLPLSIFDNLMIGNYKRLHHGIFFNVFKRKSFMKELEQNVEAARSLVKVFDTHLADMLFEETSRLNMLDRRRIEICRALISRPKLVLLDEPSAGMTAEETNQLMEDINQIRSHSPDLAIVLIEHEMSAIERVSDRCVVLSFGTKIKEGTFAEVTKDPQVREAYLGTE